MTHRILLLSAAAALLALGGCKKETIVAGNQYDPQAEELAKAKPVALPPSIVASKTFRCKDNSLAFVEFMSNNTATFRAKKDGEPTLLTQPAADKPYTAQGYSVSGNGNTVQIESPGKSSQSCHV